MNHRTLNLNLPVIGLALVFAFLAGYNAVVPPKPAVVATIDVERMYVELDEQRTADGAIEAAEKEHEAVIKELRSEVERLRSELEFLEPGSSAYREMEEKLELATVRFAARGEYAQQSLEQLKAESWRLTYQSIKAAARQYAGANGIDMVLLDDSIPPLKPSGSINEVLDQISGRRMIFTTPTMDVTSELLEFMNAQFVAAGNAP